MNLPSPREGSEFCTLVHSCSFLRPAPLASIDRALSTPSPMDDAFPIKPQRAVAELRAALRPDDIVISDVGAHKLWLARLYTTYEPNTLIISNGLAAMGMFPTHICRCRRAQPDLLIERGSLLA